MAKVKNAEPVPDGVYGYNVRAKEKQKMTKVVIDVTKGKYIAKGFSSSDTGQKMTCIMSKGNAENAVKQKWAKKGEGW